MKSSWFHANRFEFLNKNSLKTSEAPWRRENVQTWPANIQTTSAKTCSWNQAERLRRKHKHLSAHAIKSKNVKSIEIAS